MRTKANFMIGRIFELNEDEQTMTMLSHSTPCAIKLPKTIDIIYDWKNLEKFENCNLEILNIKLRGKIYYETILGHHCEVKVKFVKWYDLLNLSKECENIDIVLGFCQNEDWSMVKNNLTLLREEGIQE